MNYEIGDKVRFTIDEAGPFIGEIVDVLEEQQSYGILAATLLGTQQKAVVPESNILGKEDFKWK